MYEITCKYCEELFLTPRVNTKYCSVSCKQSAYRKRTEEQEKTETYFPALVETVVETIKEEEEIPQTKEITTSDSRKIQANGYFIHFIIHLRNIYGQEVKRKKILAVLNGFESLKTSYTGKSIKDYSLYPFANDLEYFIAELSSFIKRKTKKKTTLIISEFFETRLYEIEGELTQSSTEIRRKYR